MLGSTRRLLLAIVALVVVGITLIIVLPALAD
jgi:hypothetical protein